MFRGPLTKMRWGLEMSFLGFWDSARQIQTAKAKEAKAAAFDREQRKADFDHAAIYNNDEMSPEAVQAGVDEFYNGDFTAVQKMVDGVIKLADIDLALMDEPDDIQRRREIHDEIQEAERIFAAARKARDEAVERLNTSRSRLDVKIRKYSELRAERLKLSPEAAADHANLVAEKQNVFRSINSANASIEAAERTLAESSSDLRREEAKRSPDKAIVVKLQTRVKDTQSRLTGLRAEKIDLGNQYSSLSRQIANNR